MADVVTFSSRSLSYKCSCFVLNACGTITEKMREVLPYVDEDRAFLEDPENGGGSSIIGANSMIVAGPMSGREEGLLVADIDLEDCVKAKLVHDYSGHYNRPDIFTLTLNTSVPKIFQIGGTGESLASQEDLTPLASDGPGSKMDSLKSIKSTSDVKDEKGSRRKKQRG
jgi:aliphatic nitrilase